MMPRLFALVVVAAWPLLAAAKKPLRVVPAVYNPGGLAGIASDWEPFSGPGNSDPALVMTKLQPTYVNAAALAVVDGADGETLTELGFDVFDGGHCGAGAPRFNVLAEDPDTHAVALYFFGCSYGEHAPSPDKPDRFTRVRFTNDDAFAQYADDPPWPGFGRAIIRDLAIVFDEGNDAGQSGFTALDDIDVNGELVGRGHGRD